MMKDYCVCCEYADGCEDKDVGFCEGCSDERDCTILEYCDAGYAIQCNNGYEEETYDDDEDNDADNKREAVIERIAENIKFKIDESPHAMAINIYDLGYRKETDTINAFKEKVKAYLTDVSCCGYIESAKLWQLCSDIDELAEKMKGE